MKKSVLALVVLLMAALLFTGCPKEAEPKAPTLDGTWNAEFDIIELFKMMLDEDDEEEASLLEMLDTLDPVVIIIDKMEVTGTTCKCYSLDMQAYYPGFFALMESRWASGVPFTPPEPVYITEPNIGSITLNGKTVTMSVYSTSIGDTTTQTGSLSDDGKTITFVDEGMVINYVKQ